jgi:hypothetical protein
LAGEGILRIPEPSSHFVAIRWQDDQEINELTFRVGVLEWKNILHDLQAAVPNHSLVTSDAQQLRKEFNVAKQQELRISLGSAVNVGRWPTLESGDYRIVVIERPEERPEVFFFMLADKQFEKPRAVAAAHLRKLPSGGDTDRDPSR